MLSSSKGHTGDTVPDGATQEPRIFDPLTATMFGIVPVGVCMQQIRARHDLRQAGNVWTAELNALSPHWPTSYRHTLSHERLTTEHMKLRVVNPGVHVHTPSNTRKHSGDTVDVRSEELSPQILTLRAVGVSAHALV